MCVWSFYYTCSTIVASTLSTVFFEEAFADTPPKLSSRLLPNGCSWWPAFSHQPTGNSSLDVNAAQNWLDNDQPSNAIKRRSRLTSFTVAGQMRWGFLGSTASSLSPGWNSFLVGRAGESLKQCGGANCSGGVVVISLSKKRGHRLNSKPKPNGGDMWRPLIGKLRIYSNFIWISIFLNKNLNTKFLILL